LEIVDGSLTVTSSNQWIFASRRRICLDTHDDTERERETGLFLAELGVSRFLPDGIEPKGGQITSLCTRPTMHKEATDRVQNGGSVRAPPDRG